MALIDFTQIKGSKTVLNKLSNALDKSAVVAESSETPADDKVLSEKAVESRVTTVVHELSVNVEEHVDAPADTLVLRYTPTDEKVRLVVNGITYAEGEAFMVDRDTRTVTWTGEFPLTTATVDSMTALYTVTGDARLTGGAEHVYGMVLTNNGVGTSRWVRVDRDLNPVDFSEEHGTWANMREFSDTQGEFVEIPTTWVKTETLQTGEYAGCNVWWTADGPEDGFHVHPAFLKANGEPGNIQISAWLASNNTSSYTLLRSVNKGSSTTSSASYLHARYYNIHQLSSTWWSTANVRAYTLYDHHFLARMMMTEFGSPTSEYWENGTTGIRPTYRGIHDIFGTGGNGTALTDGVMFDGCTTENGTYHLLAADGSGSMVDTGVPCMFDGSNLGEVAWPTNFYTNKVNGIDFGDVFIANGSDYNTKCVFDAQSLLPDKTFWENWLPGNQDRGMLGLLCRDSNNKSLVWFRFVRVVDAE